MQEISKAGIDAILALASLEETRRKSPDYAQAIADNHLPCIRKEFPITDYSAPPDRDAYLRFVHEAAADLRAGKKILVHCGAGIGRTGMTAVSILTALGFPLDDTLLRVEAAGSGPETPEQDALVEWASQQPNPFPPHSI